MNKKDFIFSFPQLKEYLKEKGIDADRAHLPVPPYPDHPFNLLVPTYYLDLINWYDSEDPLRKMVITSNLEHDIQEYQVSDPIGDHAHSPVPGIVHRYPDRCLLMLTAVCAVHCRFCFRKNLLSTHRGDFEKSMHYIETHPEIWEVILSGGDPFMHSDHFLKNIIDQLNTIPHVTIIRFHTRTPTVYPKRLTDTFIDIVSRARSPIVVIHINHPSEVTNEFSEVMKKLRSKNVMLLSQTVLMKGVNNNPKLLEELFKKLVAIGVKPYYLHHLDMAAGTHHFRVSVEEGKSIMRALRGHVSGVALPEYVIDMPGGWGKIPVSWFQRVSQNSYQAVSFTGKPLVYTDPAYNEV